MFGAIEVLVPLRIDDLGGGHALIAAGFIVGAAIEAVLAPIAGRYSDRVGRRTPFVAGPHDLRGGDGRDRRRAGRRRRDRRRCMLTSLGAGLCFAPALTLLSETAEVEPPPPGLRGRALEHGLGVGTGGRRDRRRRGRRASPATPRPSVAIAALLLVTVAYALRR